MIQIKYTNAMWVLLISMSVLFPTVSVGMYGQIQEYQKIVSTYEKEVEELQTIVEDAEFLIDTQKEEIVILNDLVAKQADEYDKLKKQQQNNDRRYVGNFNLSFYSKEQFPNSRTATGVYPQDGLTVAVDPNVIPLGTKLYIEGFGVRIAQDTGGAIKGNKMDVFVNTTAEALQLGVKKNVKVWVIK